MLGAVKPNLCLVGLPLGFLVQNKRRNMLDVFFFDFNPVPVGFVDTATNIHDEVVLLLRSEALLADNVLDVEPLVVRQVGLLALKSYELEVHLEVCDLRLAHCKPSHLYYSEVFKNQ